MDEFSTALIDRKAVSRRSDVHMGNCQKLYVYPCNELSNGQAWRLHSRDGLTWPDGAFTARERETVGTKRLAATLTG